MKSLIENVKDIIIPILKTMELEFFDIAFKKEGKNRILRIVIDKQNGLVSIGECSKVSEKIGAAIEENNLITDKYFLEVTSPGLDRPLRDWRDFAKFKGKLIKFETHFLINSRRNFLGRIKDANNEFLIINIRDSGDIKFGYHEIAKAHLELEF
ncbi:MAG: ribosome maturation factor RimP [Candidatus Firestonebacteria bacterium]|nr:ribosome maturation factor RimP [Candidatus Firestonebacteria bacterium]